MKDKSSYREAVYQEVFYLKKKLILTRSVPKIRNATYFDLFLIY